MAYLQKPRKQNFVGFKVLFSLIFTIIYIYIGYAGAGDLAAFKAYVKGIWFGLYVRDGTTDTSG